MSSIKNNLFYSVILSVSQVLMPLISIPFIARVLDPSGVGKVNFIDSFTYYFITIAEFGIMVYGIREIARHRNDRKALQQLVAELMVLHLVSSAITMLLYSITVYFIWSRIDDVRLLLFSVSFLLVNAFACEWYFLGTERFKYITVRSLITRILGLISIFILISDASDYYIYYGIIVAAACGNGIWNTVSLFRELPLRFKEINWKRHLKHTWVTYAISLLYSATIMLDNVILRLASTVTAVAYYSFAMKIVRIAGLLLSDSLLVFFPRIVSLLKDNEQEKLQAVMLNSIRMIIFLAVPLTVGLFLLSGELVHVYLGASFSTVADDLRIVAVFPLLKILSLFMSKQVLVANNNEKLYLKNLAAGCVVFCALTPLLSFYFADRGACYAILITESVILFLNYYYAARTLPEIQIFDVKSLLYAVLGTMVFLPVVFVVRIYAVAEFWILVWSAFLCATAYFAIQVYIIRDSFALNLKAVVWKYISSRNHR